ncbi:methyl-accepting chemotaxis protein [Domibacillus mangrovi]|uniref:Methyl-accepting chemotaxis protein n=1 Tax=Domibacillus mangrovi TaxID=1714354 RepID=A0A1Q5P277_9BACI|nr:methyl-accepting chemotaxis protein [Domibacillus mangrovi]OKL36326.1 methyl-accepting chemotaxis protein [Domibacillus mangrovi]
MGKTKSIAKKLSILIIGLFLLLFAVYAAVTNIMLYNKSIDDAESYAIKNTQLSAAKISDRFDETAEMLRTMKMMVESMQADEQLTAASALHTLQTAFAGNEYLFGLGIVLESGTVPIEPNVDKTLVDSRKRFLPYLYKGESEVEIEGLKGYGKEGDWNLIPINEQRAVLTEAYEYELDGKMINLVSTSMPLTTSDGSFLGVIVADFSIEFMEKLVESGAPERGFSRIISDQGFIMADSIDKNQVGTSIDETIDWDRIKPIIDEGKESTLYIDSQTIGESSYSVFAPVLVNGIEEKWSVQTSVPKSSILAAFKKTIVVTVIAAIVMIVMMAVATLWFIHRQLKPLQFLRSSIETAATGDLTEKVDTKHLQNDEIGAVAYAFNDMLGKVSGVIQTVRDSTLNLNRSSNDVHHVFEEVVASNQEVAAAVEEIAQGASKQSEDTEDTGNQIAGLSERIDVLSVLSGDMNELSQQASESTQQGMSQVSLLRERNVAANDMNIRVKDQMQGLSAKISDIETVIEAIHGITAQTNLLALNASIEAARAGEHGRGFAVVAAEVRKLAEQSRMETDVIQKTVQDILHASKQTSTVIDENMVLMDGQNESVSNTESAFVKQAEIAERIGHSVDELTSKLQEMVGQKEQAMLSIQNVSAISEETAASAEEVSASATGQHVELERVAKATEEMNEIARELKEIVDRFKV